MTADVTLPQLVDQALLDAIPRDTPLWAYLEWAARRHPAPPIYHVCSAIAAGCVELARRGFCLSGGHPLGMWFSFLGASASGKSSAINMIDDFVHELWTEYGCAPTVDPWVQAAGSVAGLLTAVGEHFEAGRGTTVCMLYEHEFSSLFYTREAIAEFLCNLSDGATVQRNLRELQQPRGPRQVQRLDRVYLPVTSALFATTEPAMSAVFTDAMRHGGLFSRVWWIKPPHISRAQQPMRLSRNKAGLHYAPLRAAAMTMWGGWLAGLSLHETKVLTLSDAADTLLQVEFETPLDKRSEDADDPMNPSRNRAVDKAEVLAGLFATMCGRVEIVEADITLAMRLMHILLGYTQELADLGSSEIIRSTSKAERVIRARGEEGVLKRELYRRLHLDKRQLELVVGTLLDRGSVIEDKSDRQVKYLAADTDRARDIHETRQKRLYDFEGGEAVIDLTRRKPQGLTDN